MKKITEIIKGVELIASYGAIDIEISSIEFNSQKVEKGDLFVAVKGCSVDGHNYINQAIKNGAIAVVCEEIPSVIEKHVCYLLTKKSSYALGIIASNFFDNPSSKLKLIGVTGTNGKTTIVDLLYQLFKSMGFASGMLSTIQNIVNEKIVLSSHTTADALQINSLLNQMIENNCEYCFMEVSSHSIDQNRIAGLEFAGGVFTNITHDHLDYHKTFKEYLKTKKKFFDYLHPNAFALSNIDDKNGKIILQNTKAKKYTYSLKSASDFKSKILEDQFEGLQLNIDGVEVWFKLVGDFNAYNLLAVYASAILLSLDKSEILQNLSNLKPAEGRFDIINCPEKKIAIIDYAHTPDALKNVLDVIQRIKSLNSKVICVVGAGGDRDKEKRRLMAKIACESSDRVILTSDNPRSEDPQKIIDQMKVGVDVHYNKKVISIIDRKEAIKAACALTNSGDIILVAGKGHEKYQIIKGVKYPFDDKKIVKKILLTNNAE
ncbi:MAG: UDP-N-acetylmuramoyl-L-alanyl-D-glutamate--2,6-diaminopimelate ligase [Bacteroidales bacterium]|nr:UDP-N-acetylmuramoyl-L-alanyl-D-glutamate--2,6-diaminopimelate ligase [Bacteroidales bacterium]